MTGEDGEQIGIVSLRAALEAADEAGVDLVEIAPMAEAARVPLDGLRQVEVRRSQARPTKPSRSRSRFRSRKSSSGVCLSLSLSLSLSL